VRAALAAGAAVADEEIDGGADLLIAGDMGIGNTTAAAVLVAAVTGNEPVAVVGRGTGIDDVRWMRKASAVRDGLRRSKASGGDPVELLRIAGGADIAAMAAFLAQAAARRTPVLLDGMVVGSAALLAEQLAPGATQWWVAGHRSVEPAHTLALAHLNLVPLLDLQMRLGEGTGAVAALPLLQLAIRVLGEMATFDDAAVSGPTGSATGPSHAAPEQPMHPGTDQVAGGPVDSGTTTDPGPTDPGPTDTGATDTGATDTGATDTGEAEPGTDAPGSVDAGATGSGTVDAGEAPSGEAATATGADSGRAAESGLNGQSAATSDPDHAGQRP
jgi:nicotinate-nucleotide--dimethylbenzimidazole phosphoribosyltransferase